MILIELMQADHGICFWLNPNTIDEMQPHTYGNTLLRLRDGRVWVVKDKPSDILDKIRKAREDEKGKVETEGT